MGVYSREAIVVRNEYIVCGLHLHCIEVVLVALIVGYCLCVAFWQSGHRTRHVVCTACDTSVASTMSTLQPIGVQ